MLDGYQKVHEKPEAQTDSFTLFTSSRKGGETPEEALRQIRKRQKLKISPFFCLDRNSIETPAKIIPSDPLSMVGILLNVGLLGTSGIPRTL